jgi:hypothetical protein
MKRSSFQITTAAVALFLVMATCLPVAAGNSVTELNGSNGDPISPATGFTGGGLAGPVGVAIDSSVTYGSATTRAAREKA